MNQVSLSKFRKLSGQKITELVPLEITVDDQVIVVVSAPVDTPAPAPNERPGHFPPRRT